MPFLKENSSLPSWQSKSQDKLLAPNRLEDFSLELRRQGKRLVTLNGSFDLLHAGHLHCIYQASLLGDILLMLVNSDTSVAKYKGPTRPIIPLKYRMQMLCALGFVDFVSYFHETDPCAALKKLRPHVHVNSSEYGQNCIEASTLKDLGSELVLIDRIDSLSTSAVMDKILQSRELELMNS